MLLQIDLETRHHLPRKLVEILAVHTQILIGHVDAQVIEERSFQRGVSLAARIDERIADGASLPPQVVYLTDERGDLDEIGACARNDTYLHSVMHFTMQS